MVELQKRVRKFMEKQQMIQPGDLVIAAVSGGPDSLAMLHVLKELQAVLAFSLHVAHLDHSFRGQEAVEEARWVEKIAEKWGLPCTVKKIDVPAWAREKKFSSQEAGHLMRKKFLGALFKKIGAQKIALGHQADDQAETVLMHFLGGAGLEGLQGLLPQNGASIRPLLFLTRREIEDYCFLHGLKPRRDPSNAQNIYLRNQIRHEIIPFLQAKINPNLVQTLNRTALILREEESFLRNETREKARDLLKTKGAGISLSLLDWDTFPICLQRRLLRWAYQQVEPGQGLLFEHVTAVGRLIEQGEVGKVLHLPGRINVEKERGQVLFYRREDCAHKEQGITPQELVIPGVTFFPESGQMITAEIIKGRREKSEKEKVYLPEEILTDRIWGRSRQPGDKFTFPGMAGKKRVKDFLRERGVPRQQRQQILLVLCGPEIIWLPGLAIGKKCLAESPTGKYLVLTLADNLVDSPGEAFEKNEVIW